MFCHSALVMVRSHKWSDKTVIFQRKPINLFFDCTGDTSFNETKSWLVLERFRLCPMVSHIDFHDSQCSYIGQHANSETRHFVVKQVNKESIRSFKEIRYAKSLWNLFNLRFIQPVRRRSKRRYEQYDKSPVFDSLIPVTGNVCSHKHGCDAFILQVIFKIIEKSLF